MRVKLSSVAVALATLGCVGSLAVLPTTAQAAARVSAVRAAMSMPGANSKPGSVASSFCAHFTASKVSSVVGLKVKLLEAIAEKKTLECIYLSTVQVIISREPGIPASELATRAKAEARVKAESPKGVKFTFSSLPSLGATAFTWSYELNGGLLIGVADNKGTTGFGTVLGGKPSIVGAPGRVAALERLIKMDMVA
jgi:hypothetical protein